MKYDLSKLNETSDELENGAINSELRRAQIELAKAISRFVSMTLPFYKLVNENRFDAFMYQGIDYPTANINKHMPKFKNELQIAQQCLEKAAKLKAINTKRNIKDPNHGTTRATIDIERFEAPKQIEKFIEPDKKLATAREILLKFFPQNADLYEKIDPAESILDLS